MNTSDELQDVALASQLLSYEIALAGYDTTLSASAKPSLSAPSLELTIDTRANASDAVLVRYVEDRFTASGHPEMVAVEFLADRDRNRKDNLYRCIQNCQNDKQPAVAQIKDLTLVAFVTRDGSREPLRASNPQLTSADTLDELEPDIAALHLEFTTSSDDVHELIIALPNPQDIRINFQ